MFLDLTEFFAGTGFRPPRKPYDPPDPPPNTGKPPKPKPKPNPGDDDDIPIKKKGTKRKPGEDADEVDNLKKMKDSDFIKPTDSPADVATKKSLLSQAGEFVAAHPLLTISAAGLAYYMFTTGQSLPEAVSSLGLSAGSAVGNALTSAVSGLTGIPKDYVKYIWWALLALFVFYLFMKLKGFLTGE